MVMFNGWLVGWLDGWLVVGRLVGILLNACLIGWLVNGLNCYLINWLDGLVGSMDWSTLYPVCPFPS